MNHDHTKACQEMPQHLRFARTTHEAFPSGVAYAAALERPSPRRTRYLRWVFFCVCLGVVACLFL